MLSYHDIRFLRRKDRGISGLEWGCRRDVCNEFTDLSDLIAVHIFKETHRVPRGGLCADVLDFRDESDCAVKLRKGWRGRKAYDSQVIVLWSERVDVSWAAARWRKGGSPI